MQSSITPVAVSDQPISTQPAVTVGSGEFATHFFVLTFRTRDGLEGTAYSGIKVAPGATRGDVYEWAVAGVAKQLKRESFVTAFFSLEPNQLAVANTDTSTTPVSS